MQVPTRLTNHILTIPLRYLFCVVFKQSRRSLLTRNVHATLNHAEHGDRYEDRLAVLFQYLCSDGEVLSNDD